MPLFLLTYPWNRHLDGKDINRDVTHGESNPGAQVVGLLESGAAPWGIVTNGKLWRLYSAKAHSRATNYYEIDLEETLASPAPGEAFRYFFGWLLFLFYAESRDLLPIRKMRGYHKISLQRLKEEIAAQAGVLEDEAPQLFNVIDQGSASYNVPAYNGGLFMTDPDPNADGMEAETARFLQRAKLPDRYLALGLDLMARDVDAKRGDLGKSLGVRQLGSIYEGLLEFKLRIAPERMAVVEGKRAEEVIPYGEAIQRGRKILTGGSGGAVQERVSPKADAMRH